jgi:Zn-dependent peptidase ImmA (M78 family)/transcriptional regulator with XRE-family HTH domain
MLPIDPSRMGERIAEARGRAGLTQVQLAGILSIDRSALAKIEGGSRRVTAIELARIADALNERIEWFVMDAPSAIVSHRNLQEPGAPSPVIDRDAERAARNVEFVLEHDEAWTLTAPEPLARPSSIEDAEKSATKARSLLGLGQNDEVIDLPAQVAKLGLLPFSITLGVDSADAASILLDSGGVALINGRLKVGRRRLALAHELGHYLFADEYTVDWRIAEQDDDAAWETRLDRFARALLLPAEGLRTSWSDAQQRQLDLRRAAIVTASRFRVDMTTLSRRLLELGVVERSDADQIRLFRTRRADIVELNLLVGEELEPPALPDSYEKAVLRLYNRETISAPRALDLLLDTWTEDELPALPSLPEEAVWQFTS